MQEEIERRTIAVAMSGSRITGRALAKALEAALQKIRQSHQKAQTPQGRQSAKKLMNHGVNTNVIPLDGSTRTFDRVARKWNVDYHFRKIGPKKYMLLFKAGQADAITQCFAEYTKRIMRKEQRQSIRGRMGRINDAITRQRPPEHERKREAAHDDR